MPEVDDYIATATSADRTEFERMSHIVKQTVPSVEQGRSYGMPAFFYKDRPLIAFVATKKHLSLYPFSGKVIDRLRDKLTAFNLSSGTIRFSVESPIPELLLKEILASRLQEIDERESKT